MYENPNKFMEIYHISQSSRGILIDFFRQNGSKFVNSSILQKTKRMDGLIMSLPNLYNYLNKDNFELEFEKYLINIDFNNEVKKNPIIESTFFCEHIIQKTGDDLLRTIALYEKEKNNLLKDKINFKLSGGGGFLPHQDHPAFTRFIKEEIFNIMIPVDDMNIANGCLYISKIPFKKKSIPHNSGQTLKSAYKNYHWIPIQAKL